MPLETSPSVSLDTLKASAVWARLSPQQRLLLTEYLAAGLAQGKYDIEAACKIAYPKVKNRKVWLARLKSNPRIRAVLHFYFGDPEAKDPLDELKALIRKSKRKNGNHEILLGPWLRVTAALEAIAAKDTVKRDDLQ
jgi:hypothetical protein